MPKSVYQLRFELNGIFGDAELKVVDLFWLPIKSDGPSWIGAVYAGWGWTIDDCRPSMPIEVLS